MFIMFKFCSFDFLMGQKGLAVRIYIARSPFFNLQSPSKVIHILRAKVNF